MCIVAIAHQASGRYPLIVAANRDERHARPTAAADWWGQESSLLAGRDLEAGGTWLGVTRTGRFAAVTNIFEGSRMPGELSRGSLVTSFLEGSAAPLAHAESVQAQGARYAPFNLVLRDGDSVQFVSNRHPMESLGAGVHVFSNNGPGLEWSKVELLGDVLKRAVEREDLTDYLIETLSGGNARGPLAKAADSMFIVGQEFGTRCTTVLTIDGSGGGHFVEQRFAPGGTAGGRSEYRFEISDENAG